MADSKHVEMLRGDLNHWQEWRDENPDLRPDLSKASLREHIWTMLTCTRLT